MRQLEESARTTLMAMGCFFVAALAGCGAGAPKISVNFLGGNSQTITLGQPLTITATVLNDSSGQGVTWKFTGLGTLSNPTAVSAQYVAPCGVTSSQVAMVTATAVADPAAFNTFTVTISPAPLLTILSCDPFTNSTSQHATEVEPDTFAFGSTLVSAYQVGRIFSGGASDIGFATSTDGGVTWTSGLLSGLTTFAGGPTSFNSVSDPSVAYDAFHGQWIIASIAVQEDASGNVLADQVFVSRSPDGIAWGNPIAVNPLSSIPPGYDKDWIVCDSTATSPFYGHCYIEWDSFSGALVAMTTSTDGGLTWQAPRNTADSVHGAGGQPLVQPKGTVIVPMIQGRSSSMLSFTSTDGGASWSATTVISSFTDHAENGNLRSGPLPTAEMDAAGTVYLVWSDCRFRTNCSSNDLVLSTSSDGVSWMSPARIPIDPVTSTVDHFIPGLAVDRTTSGVTAHLALTYYYYPVSACGAVCDLDVGSITSQDGGQTWSAPVQLAGPMRTDWLANTSGGPMVGDYISGSYVNGNPFAVFAVAAANDGTVFDEPMYTTSQPLLIFANSLRFSSKGERPVPNARSDHPPREFCSLCRRPPL